MCLISRITYLALTNETDGFDAIHVFMFIQVNDRMYVGVCYNVSVQVLNWAVCVFRASCGFGHAKSSGTMVWYTASGSPTQFYCIFYAQRGDLMLYCQTHPLAVHNEDLGVMLKHHIHYWRSHICQWLTVYALYWGPNWHYGVSVTFALSMYLVTTNVNSLSSVHYFGGRLALVWWKGNALLRETKNVESITNDCILITNKQWFVDYAWNEVMNCVV